MMVAAVSTTDPQNPKITPSQDDRSPFDNNNNVSRNPRKPKSKIVSSRYMSSSPSTSTSTSNSSSVSSSSSSSIKRHPSPLISRNPVSNSPSLVPKRSISVDRRRPSPAKSLIPENAPEISAATKLLVTSTRRLSVSFQGEAFSLPISKTKVAPPSPNVRKMTPERKRNSTPSRVENNNNSKPSDHHRWPARNRTVDLDPLSRPSLDLGNNSEVINGNSVNSDSDSVSSGSNSEIQESVRASLGSNGPRGISVSAKFWQETNSRLRKLQDYGPGSPQSPSPQSKPIGMQKMKRFSSDCALSPIRGPATPGKAMTPSPRGYSPSRIRNAVSIISTKFTETPSVLSFAVDVRRGKVGENQIVDAHLLRLFYNRDLQWRFVNARSEAVLVMQKHSAEKNLWNAWITISDLRDTVTKKRHRLQLLRQKLKLASILKGQMSFLEDWACLDKDHSISLLGAIEALKASTLRLPIVGGAIADVQSLKDAIGSSFDVIQAMTSSIFSLLPTIEEVNSLLTELAKLTAKERALLEQCTDFISLLASMQVKDSSLRTHIIQHNR